MAPTSLQLGSLRIGDRCRVVGTASTPEGMHTLAPLAVTACEIVELRVDGLNAPPEQWIGWGRAFLREGLPVLATCRHRSEGGDWHQGEAERLQTLRQAWEVFPAIDVEIRSEIFPELLNAPPAPGKVIVASFHDFERTPSLAELIDAIGDLAQHPGVILKVVTMFQDPDDFVVLSDLLDQDWPAPVCAMGMGPLGAETRVDLARQGSALVYGYLDHPAAPGQPSGGLLMATLRRG